MMMMMMMMMKLPILPCAEKLELVLSTAPLSESNSALREITCHMGSHSDHSATWQQWLSRLTPAEAGTRLATREGRKAELT